MSGTPGGVRQAARPGGVTASGAEDLFLGVNLSGYSTAQQRGHELTLRDGDAVLATRGLTGFTVTRPTLVRFVGFRVPRETIAPLVHGLDDGPIRLIPRGTESLNLLIAYANAFADEQSALTPDLQLLVTTHIQDLIAATIGAARDGQAITSERGIRAAQLRAIMADINANIGDGDLTVAEVAQRHRVTPRYVHKLLEGGGLTFSVLVRNRRLSRAHRMLSDPRFEDQSISSIAFEVGFGDLSYFNRLFRRRYDATPSETRARAGPSRTVRH
jgi:AraC-like DNA-binding protein